MFTVTPKRFGCPMLYYIEEEENFKIDDYQINVTFDEYHRVFGFRVVKDNILYTETIDHDDFIINNGDEFIDPVQDMFNDSYKVNFDIKDNKLIIKSKKKNTNKNISKSITLKQCHKDYFKMMKALKNSFDELEKCDYICKPNTDYQSADAWIQMERNSKYDDKCVFWLRPDQEYLENYLEFELCWKGDAQLITDVLKKNNIESNWDGYSISCINITGLTE